MSYIGNSPTSVAFLTDSFSGTGSQTAFTLSAAPANTSSILVAVSGVLQDPTTYSTTGTTLTFSAAPPAGTGNISVRFLGIPASGVVNTAYRTQTEFTATAGQTTFSVPSYTVGFIDVYRNGALLGSADFTATSGTTVVLNNAASEGDLVETVSFFVSSVINAIPAVAGAVNDTYLNTNAVTTTKIADANVTPAKLSQPFTSGTAVASTSGTSIDFTSIPSWVKRITVMFSGMSLNANTNFLVQIGSGSFTTSGYNSTSSYIPSGSPTTTSSTAGFLMYADSDPFTISGSLTIFNINSNSWVSSHTIKSGTTTNAIGGGDVSLGGVLDRVRITSVNGTATFDAGSINILYE
jgi:hypothetical protein